MNLSRSGKVTRVANAAVAGTGPLNSAAIDMSGDFSSVTFYVAFGTILQTAVVDVRAQGSSDGSTWADLAGTAVPVSDASSNFVAVLEVDEPIDRYIRAVVTREVADVVVDAVIAVQTRAKHEPVTHDTMSVAGSEYHHSPVQGTA